MPGSTPTYIPLPPTQQQAQTYISYVAKAQRDCLTKHTSAGYTATDILGKKAIFCCPLPDCSHEWYLHTTAQDFHLHIEGPTHRSCFHEGHGVQCSFCRASFPTEYSVFRHQHFGFCSSLESPEEELSNEGNTDCTDLWFSQYTSSASSSLIDSWNCIVCNEDFASKAHLVEHPQEHRTDQDHNLIGHAAKLGSLVFAVPEEYLVPVKAVLASSYELACAGVVFPLYEILRTTHVLSTILQEDHLIFIFRHSTNNTKSDHLQEHIVLAIKIALVLHSSGRARVRSIAVICNRRCRGCFMPSFAEGPDLEARLVKGYIPAGSRTHTQLKQLFTWGPTAFYATRRIKDQILYAKIHGRRPVLVSMGFNAISHSWERLSAFAEMYEAQYGHLDIWMRITGGEAKGGREETSQTICPIPVGEDYFEFYSTTQINNHRRGTLVHEGISLWKENLEVLEEVYALQSSVGMLVAWTCAEYREALPRNSTFWHIQPGYRG